MLPNHQFTTTTFQIEGMYVHTPGNGSGTSVFGVSIIELVAGLVNLIFLLSAPGTMVYID